jgi:hypothetical protein
MDERGNDKPDEKKKDSSCDLDPSGCCDCPDGPGCLAVILFIVLMFVVYGVYYLLASMLGYEPVAMRDWDKAGLLFWLVLTFCLSVSGYAWYWMDNHWK